MLRSMLFAPGNQARKVEKASTEVPADAVILDLEDAVPIAAKEETRADFTADAGATWTPGEEELLLARTQLVHASRLAGLEPPVDTVYPHFRDREGLERTSRRARDLGFQGRTCIHPDQVAPVNRIFSPSPEEIAWAEEVMAAFTEAEARGVAAIQVRGQLIDYAFLPRARRILAQAGRLPEPHS